MFFGLYYIGAEFYLNSYLHVIPQVFFMENFFQKKFMKPLADKIPNVTSKNNSAPMCV